MELTPWDRGQDRARPALEVLEHRRCPVGAVALPQCVHLAAQVPGTHGSREEDEPERSQRPHEQG
jgi:hypothetical protein